MAEDRMCFEKAVKRGQRTFTLVEQDMSSPAVLGEWIKLGIINGVPARKLYEALDTAIEMRDSKIEKKVPD